MYVVSPGWNLQVLRFSSLIGLDGLSRWLCGLRRGPAATSVLGLRDRIPSENGYMFLLRLVCFWVRVLCDGPITRPKNSY